MLVQLRPPLGHQLALLGQLGQLSLQTLGLPGHIVALFFQRPGFLQHRQAALRQLGLVFGARGRHLILLGLPLLCVGGVKPQLLGGLAQAFGLVAPLLQVSGQRCALALQLGAKGLHRGVICGQLAFAPGQIGACRVEFHALSVNLPPARRLLGLGRRPVFQQPQAAGGARHGAVHRVGPAAPDDLRHHSRLALGVRFPGVALDVVRKPQRLTVLKQLHVGHRQRPRVPGGPGQQRRRQIQRAGPLGGQAPVGQAQRLKAGLSQHHPHRQRRVGAHLKTRRRICLSQMPLEIRHRRGVQHHAAFVALGDHLTPISTQLAAKPPLVHDLHRHRRGDRRLTGQRVGAHIHRIHDHVGAGATGQDPTRHADRGNNKRVVYRFHGGSFRPRFSGAKRSINGSKAIRPRHGHGHLDLLPAVRKSFFE